MLEENEKAWSVNAITKVRMAARHDLIKANYNKAHDTLQPIWWCFDENTFLQKKSLWYLSGN